MVHKRARWDRLKRSIWIGSFLTLPCHCGHNFPRSYIKGVVVICCMAAAKRHRLFPAPRYDFAVLALKSTELQQFMHESGKRSKRKTVDFSRPGATLALARAILAQHFSLQLSLPPGQLVPTIPAREQYLSWAHSLVAEVDDASTLLDIGTGPSAIYTLLAARKFRGDNWKFIGTDIDRIAVAYALDNVSRNKLCSRITVLSRDAKDCLIPDPHSFTNAPLRLTVCNPPFYDEGQTPSSRPPPGTGGQTETTGGEIAFLSRLAHESIRIPGVWFTSLVGIKSDLSKIARTLRSAPICASRVVTVELAAGLRTRRWAVAWYFGSTSSTVKFDTESTTFSKWRKKLQVVPSGRQAGLLDMNAMGDVISKCLRQEGWKALLEEAEGYTLCAAHDEDGGALQCIISYGKTPNSFEITLKCASAGTGSARLGICDLATRMCGNIESFLDSS